MSIDSTPLTGKRAVVLGGTGGIGSAISNILAQAGACVAVVAGHDVGKAEEIAGKLPGSGHRSYLCSIDDSAQLVSLAQLVRTDMGGSHILINAAGFTRSIPAANLDLMDDETFDRILVIHTRASFAAVRAFAPQLRAEKDGLVVFLSSIAATTAVGSCIAYCVAKAGLDIMGAALARALAPDIRVLTVSPGIVDTDFVPERDRLARVKSAEAEPLRRLCRAAEVAEAVLACATTLRFSTGSVIQIDGGRHLS